MNSTSSLPSPSNVSSSLSSLTSVSSVVAPLEIDSGDTALVLISAALVCLMTPGLAFFYGGLVRRKNVLNIMLQNFVSMGLVTTIWYLGGFSLAFGPDQGHFIGNLDWFGLLHVGYEPNPNYGPTVPFLAFFVFQEMFAIITPALITGAIAERVTFSAWTIFMALWSILVYIPVCHWIWGYGFMYDWGVKDFAGGLVVHCTAGMSALACVMVIGRRKIIDDSGPHNIAFVALGTGLLWFGWFGFNGGSALAANGDAADAWVCTDVAGSSAMMVWIALDLVKSKKPSMVGMLTGGVAGLATVTPCAGFIRPWAAFVIGLMASFISYGAVIVKTKVGWDDALDVWACHGVGGIMGSIVLGIFAQKEVAGVSGLIQGNGRQFGIQIAGAVITGLWSVFWTVVLLLAINLVVKIRVPEIVEEAGLDIITTADHGAYDTDRPVEVEMDEAGKHEHETGKNLMQLLSGSRKKKEDKDKKKKRSHSPASSSDEETKPTSSHDDKNKEPSSSVADEILAAAGGV